MPNQAVTVTIATIMPDGQVIETTHTTTGSVDPRELAHAALNSGWAVMNTAITQWERGPQSAPAPPDAPLPQDSYINSGPLPPDWMTSATRGTVAGRGTEPSAGPAYAAA